MQLKNLGKNGPQVSALGLGSHGAVNTPQSDAELVATIHAALDAGINFLNTADFYGSGHHEMVLGRAIKERRDEVFLSVKFGMMLSPSSGFLGLDGRPAAVKNFAAYSLQRLGVEVIDLYQPGRPDPAVPYEDTIGAVKELIEAGWVRFLGVSEVGADHLRRAHKVHPVTALEIEYSLAARFIEPEILPAARELGVGVVPYRVLADGLLSGALKEEPQGGPLTPPRMQGENFRHNVAVAAFLLQMAAEKGFSPAQLAVAWLLAQGDDIIPIVGTRRRSRLTENLAILDLHLTVDELAALDQAFAPGAIQGDRYPAFVQKFAAK